MAKKPLWKNGKPVWRAGKPVWVEDPQDCECCGPPPIPCPVCPEGYAAPNVLVELTHIANVTSGDYRCTYCNQMNGAYVVPFSQCSSFGVSYALEFEPGDVPCDRYTGLSVSFNYSESKWKVRVILQSVWIGRYDSLFWSREYNQGPTCNGEFLVRFEWRNTGFDICYSEPDHSEGYGKVTFLW